MWPSVKMNLSHLLLRKSCFLFGWVIFGDLTSSGAPIMKECISQFFPSFSVPRTTVTTAEKHTRDKTSQTAQQCLRQTSPPDGKTSQVKVPQIPEVKTESDLKVEPNLELPIKKEPEEEDQNAKDGSPLGIKIVECWSLQGIKEEPMDTPLVSQLPPYAAGSSESEGGAADVPKVKQEASGGSWEEWQSGGCPATSKKRPSDASAEEETGAETKKFRPLHQPQPQSPCEGRPNPSCKGPEGAWPVKVEKDATSHDFPAESDCEWETLGPCSILGVNQFIGPCCCCCINTTYD